MKRKGLAWLLSLAMLMSTVPSSTLMASEAEIVQETVLETAPEETPVSEATEELTVETSAPETIVAEPEAPVPETISAELETSTPETIAVEPETSASETNIAEPETFAPEITIEEPETFVPETTVPESETSVTETTAAEPETQEEDTSASESEVSMLEADIEETESISVKLLSEVTKMPANSLTVNDIANEIKFEVTSKETGTTEILALDNSTSSEYIFSVGFIEDENGNTYSQDGLLSEGTYTIGYNCYYNGENIPVEGKLTVVKFSDMPEKILSHGEEVVLASEEQGYYIINPSITSFYSIENLLTGYYNVYDEAGNTPDNRWLNENTVYHLKGQNFYLVTYDGIDSKDRDVGMKRSCREFPSELQLGDNRCSLEEAKTVHGMFTPSSTGAYYFNFSNMSSYQIVLGNESYGDLCWLEAGETYEIMIWPADYAEDVAVRISEVQEISMDQKVTTTESMTVYSFHPGQTGYYWVEMEGNGWSEIKDNNFLYLPDFPFNVQYLKEGETYYILCESYYDDYETGGYTIQVKAVKELPALTEGRQEYPINAGESGSFHSTFTPSTSGAYRFSSDMDIRVFLEGKNVGLSGKMTAGKTYDVFVDIWEDSEDSTRYIDIERIPELVDIKLAGEAIIPAGSFGSFLQSQIKILLEYENPDFQEEILYSENSVYGSVSYDLRDKETESYIWNDDIIEPEKEYILSVSSQGVQRELTVTARKFSEAVHTEEISVDQEKNGANGDCYTFIPNRTGYYWISAEVGLRSVLYDESLQRIAGSFYGFYTYYYLESGKTYYMICYVDLDDRGKTHKLVLKQAELLEPGVEKTIEVLSPDGEELGLELRVQETGKYAVKTSDYDFRGCVVGNGTEYLNGKVSSVNLEAGVSYLLYLSTGNDLQISYEHIPEITELKLVKGLEQTEFLEKFEDVNYDDCKVRIIYDNKTSAEVSVYGKDSYGNLVNGFIYAKDDPEKEPVDEWDLPKGEYVLKLSVDDKTVECPFRVVSVQDAVKVTLERDKTYTFDGTSEIEVFKYTADKSGKHKFLFKPAGKRFCLYDADEMNTVCDEQRLRNDCYADLVSGKTYYGVIKKQNKSNINATVSTAGDLKSISINANETKLIAGMKSLADMRIEVDTIYDDGKTGVISVGDEGGSDFRGTDIECHLTKDGQEYSWYSELKIGTYELTASVVGKPNIKASIQIEAEAVDMDSLPLVVEDTETAILLNNRYNLCRFIPEKDGKYKAGISHNGMTYLTLLQFYEQTQEGLESVTDLKTGNLYVFQIPEVNNYDFATIRLTRVDQEISEGGTSEGGILELDKPEEVTLFRDKSVTYTFTPAETGWYTLSSSEMEEYTDPKVSLYEDGEEIGYDDDSGESNQFILTCQLEEGHTYEYEIGHYGDYSNFRIVLEKCSPKEASGVEISLDSEEFIEAFNPIEIKATLIYGDGSVQNEFLHPSKDSEFQRKDQYGNIWKYSLRHLEDMETDTVRTYQFDITFGEKTESVQIQEKKLSGLNAKILEESKAQESDNAEADGYDFYKYVPSKDGRSIFYITDLAGESRWADIMYALEGDDYTYSFMERQSGCYMVESSLKKGETYFVGIKRNSGDAPYRITVQNQKEIVDAEILEDDRTLTPYEFVEPFSRNYKIKVSYADGTSWEGIAGSYDDCGYEFRIVTERLSKNTQRLTLLSDEYLDSEEYWDSIVMTTDLTSIQNIAVDQEITYPNGGDNRAVYRFSPEESGVYFVSANLVNGYCSVETELFDGELRYDLSYKNIWWLEAGHQYCLVIDSYGDGAYSFALKKNIHTLGDWVTVTEATCTMDGIQMRSCTDDGCTYYETQVIPRTGHTFEEKVIEPTATETGKRYHVCSKCGEEELLEIIPATEITSAEDIKTVVKNLGEAPTEEALQAAAGSVIAADNKELVNGGAMDAISTLEQKLVEGNMAGETITDENVTVEGAALTVTAQENLQEGVVGAAKISVAPADVDYSGNDVIGANKTYVMDINMSIVNTQNNEIIASNVEPAAPLRITIEIPAEYQGTKFVLYHVLSEETLEEVPYFINGTQMSFTIASLSNFVLKLTDCQGTHRFEETERKEPTCINDGYKKEICQDCGYVRESIIPSSQVNHSWQTVVDKEATCGAAGSQHEECTVCHEKKTAVSIPATGNHSWKMIVDKAAGCGTAGSQHEECTVCHEKKAAVSIPATGNHSWKMVVDKTADCGTAGSQHEECTVCHEKKAAVSIPATGAHKYGSYKVTRSATVLSAGSKTRTCSVCGHKDTASIAKLKATISVNVSSITLKEKQSTTAVKVKYGKGDSIKSWKSSNSRIASVTSKGKITGKKAGNAVITVTLKSRKTAKIRVKVQKTTVKTTKLSLNKKSLTLKKGKKYQLSAVVSPITSQQRVTYKSTKTGVATVTSKGVVLARKRGTAYIIATSGSKSVKCKVVVK